MHFAFIYNPKAGKTNAAKIRQLKNSLPIGLRATWFAWEPFEALHEVLESASKEADVIVSVGGDGTNRAIAEWLLIQSKPPLLAFIPTGSGNGLARHLGLNNPKTAIDRLTNARIQPIDVIKVNDEIALNAAGIGLSGAVSGRFGSNQIRGLNGYLMQAVKLYRSFQPFALHHSDSMHHLLSLEIGNGCEWGNGFCFAPEAEVDDGKADLALIRKQRLLQLPFTIRKMKRYQPVFENHQVKNARFRAEKPQPWHTDGEYQSPTDEWQVEILPGALSIFV
jgi:diacylglycerol kinase family enzyme